MKKYLFYSVIFSLMFVLLCCKSKPKADDAEVKPEDIQTPVTITGITTETLTDSVTLNATSSFVQDNVIKSNINGYIKAVNTKNGQYTPAGKILFTLKTKEAESLGNTIEKLDPSFHFTGVVNIAAPQSGYVTQLLHQPGDYVQDGEQLALISDSKSFGFVLNIPYEYRRYISVGKAVNILLPDGTLLNGNIASMLPTIDFSSQTQQAMIKVASSMPIPENLVVKVSIAKSVKSNVTSLPKEAVLTNESQSDFWIMKMIDSVTAVKIPIIKGFETKSRVEIVNPKLTAEDKILLTGNYGLADTAKVKIVKPSQQE